MRLFRTITPRALKPGPRPDPAQRGRDPKWFRRGRAVNGPENYDPLERRFFCGRPARTLALCAADQAGLARGQIIAGAGARFTAMTQSFVNALWVYMRVKRALYLILCPFRAKSKPRTRLQPRPTQTPKRLRRVRAPSAQDWRALDALYGFDVRMTSPGHIIARAKRLRVMLWAETPEKDETSAPSSLAPRTKTAGPDRPKAEPEDLFMVWPPIALPNLPRGTRVKAGRSLAAIRAEVSHTPQPKPLALISLAILEGEITPQTTPRAYAPPRSNPQAQPRDGPKKDVTGAAKYETPDHGSRERYV